MPKITKAQVGKIGESVTCRFFVKRGFSILERNYWKKWGEIDIIAEKNNVLHFIEVKTVSVETLKDIDNHNPEENVHYQKIKRLSRTIQTYLMEKDIQEHLDWQFDVVAVFLSLRDKKARVRLTEGVVL